MTDVTKISARLDIHKGDMTCFIPCRDWLKLDTPPEANMWRDRNNHIWAGFPADQLAGADFRVEARLADLRYMEWTGRGHGWVRDLIPVVFDDGIRMALATGRNNKPEKRDEPKPQGPGFG